ncbi:hypothetical protein BOTCAL_0140g00160 [Botryotinia calthae]|uniref:Uncharacterized protein n=1 Tax=Botryotinia calthae TaxID=38488 RepID=A0A4Y8D5S7_9HELO|nr:hypothetical protein BOTCAL_0140g00160 [Botryotinia calthae]
MVQIWTVPEVEFLKSIYEARSSRKIEGATLLNIFLTEQARHLPGGDLHSSECWPYRSIQRGTLQKKYRECCNGVDEMTTADARRMMRHIRVQAQMQEQLQQQVQEQREALAERFEWQAPVQVPQIQQQVLVQDPQTQQLPVNQAPVNQAPIDQASRPSLPPGTILLPAGNIRVSGGSIRIPPHSLLLPDKLILLPNGRILVKTPKALPPHTIQQPENGGQLRATAHFQAPRRNPNLRLPLPGIRQVVGRELQGRAHLNATKTSRATTAQVIRHRQRSTASEPSSRLSLGTTCSQPIVLDDDEDSSPTAAEIPVSDSRDETPLFAREFRNLAVDVSDKEDSSPASPIVSVDPMALISFLVVSLDDDDDDQAGSDLALQFLYLLYSGVL